MKIEELPPDQIVSVVLLGLIILSLFALGVVSVIYWMHRIATKQRFSLAEKPLATVGFIDCLQAVGLVMFLIFSAQYVMLKFDPTLIDSGKKEHVDAPELLEIESSRSIEGGHFVSARSVRADIGNAQNTILSDPISESLERADGGDGGEDKSGVYGASRDPYQLDSELHLPEDRSPENAGENDAQEGERKFSANTIVMSAVGATMQLLAVFLVYGFIRIRTGCSPEQLGVRWRSAFRDIGIGLWVLFLTIPVLLIVSGLLNSYTGIEYHHPVIDMMNQYPWLIGLVAWMAVIVAPISEEFFFRTLLIGFFESIHFGRSRRSFFLGWMPQGQGETRSSAFRESLQQTAPEQGGLTQSSGYVPPWWPAILSGVLFGIAHYSYGVSWLPLILFGIVLGRVYQLRQSLITCIAIHMVFNAINLLNLWLSLGLQK